MPTYEPAPPAIGKVAVSILAEYETHKPAEAFMDSVGQFYLQGIVATEEAHAKNSVSRFGGIAKDLAK